MKYLQSLEKFGMNLGLDRITYLLEKLGNPHKKFKSIHIAGTNGKGSTAAMTASILKEAGYKVGLYTSPHLFDYRERIKINGKDISLQEFSKGLKIIRKIEKEPRISFSGSQSVADPPTIFEALTAVAFWYFAKKKVDYAVVEVGLGGRLDATNVLTPLVSIITNIDYEHTEVLGNTLSKIASEKAAIIKPGVPLVTAENKAEPLKVIEKTCQTKQCQLLVAKTKANRPGSVRSREPRILPARPAGGFSGFRLQGYHQKLNAVCALFALLLANIKVSKSAIKKGLQNTDWPGRFQIVSKKPLIIVDGAHNPPGAKALRVTIEDTFPGKYTLIFGCQKTKDFKKVLKELKPIASNIIITKSSHQQAAEPAEIAKHIRAGEITHSAAEAMSCWDKKSPLLISGSLFLAADVLRLIRK